VRPKSKSRVALECGIYRYDYFFFTSCRDGDSILTLEKIASSRASALCAQTPMPTYTRSCMTIVIGGAGTSARPGSPAKTVN